MDKRKKREFRRRFVQAASAALYNLNFAGFTKGTIYRGATKRFCVPGLNCYSCPGAIAACPLGALQSSLNNLPTVPLYVLGLLAIFGALLGRMVCAFLCPIGLLQDLLYKFPTRKIAKGKWSRRLSWLKYVVLVGLVILVPVATLIKNGVAAPGFCKWVCPAGTLEGGMALALPNEGLRSQLGWLFTWKTAVLAAIVLASIWIYRPFCRFLCPLGAIYSLFNRIALLGIRVDESKCTHCGLCTKNCKLDVHEVNDRECIRCGECIDRCPHGALCAGGILQRRKKDEESMGVDSGAAVPDDVRVRDAAARDSGNGSAGL